MKIISIISFFLLRQFFTLYLNEKGNLNHYINLHNTFDDLAVLLCKSRQQHFFRGNSIFILRMCKLEAIL